MKLITSGKLLYNTEFTSVLCDDLAGWGGRKAGRETQEAKDICILIADSHCPTAETNTIL